MEKTSAKISLTIIALGAASRLLPHPPNVTPIAAMALLGGATLLDKRQALLAPLAALVLSDLFLGFSSATPFVYACFLATAAMGVALRENRTPGRVAAACLASSVLFFVVTNFGTWLASGMYSRDAAGLAACYTAALPFFRNSLAGDLFFTAALFGLERLSQRLIAPRLAAA